MAFRTDIEIARAANKRPIQEIGAKLGIPPDDLIPYGHDKAKVGAGFIHSLAGRPDGKLILVTAINPTPAGEGKTTTTVGLGDALNHIGKRAVICIREASLGPCFGMKGGAAGGGRAQAAALQLCGDGLAQAIEHMVVTAYRLADHQLAAALQRLADAFATGNLTTADTPGIVLEQHQVAGEVGGMGAAQVEQHAVMAGDRNDLHLGDLGGAAAGGFVHLGWGSETGAALGRNGKGTVQSCTGIIVRSARWQVRAWAKTATRPARIALFRRLLTSVRWQGGAAVKVCDMTRASFVFIGMS